MTPSTRQQIRDFFNKYYFVPNGFQYVKWGIYPEHHNNSYVDTSHNGMGLGFVYYSPCRMTGYRTCIAWQASGHAHNVGFLQQHLPAIKKLYPNVELKITKWTRLFFPLSFQEPNHIEDSLKEALKFIQDTAPILEYRPLDSGTGMWI